MIAFCWVFVGSLVQFHLDRVLEKDSTVSTWSFIKPKPKDDKVSDADVQFNAISLLSANQQLPEPVHQLHSFVLAGDVLLLEKILGPDLSLRAPPLS